MTRMRRGALLILTLLVAAPLVAAPRKSAPKRVSTPAETKLIQSCDAHKFETVVETTGDDGQPRKSKVKLCGVEGQSDAEWIGTLKDAIRKLEANAAMAPATRDQIVAAIKAEIARLSIIGAPVPSQRQAQEQGALPLSRDYAALPPLPAAPETPAIAPPPAVATTAVSTAPPPAPVVPVPKLSFSCYTPGDIGGDGPCAEFERETLLTVRASGSLPAGASLRFVRNAESRADVDLAPISGGGSMRIPLPREVCGGFGAGRLELQTAVNGAAARSDGPWPLRCY